MGSVQKTHVVLVPSPAEGHVIPIIYLARKLALHGVISTIVNTDSIHETLQQSWQQDQNIFLESISMDMRFPNGIDEKFFNAQEAYTDAIMRMEDPLAELFLRIDQRGPKISCVVSDFLHISAPHAAKKAGLPGACFFPGNAAWAAIEIHFPELMKNRDVPVKEGDDKLISYIPGMELRSQDLPFYTHEVEFLKGREELALFRSERLMFEPWFLVHSFDALEQRIFTGVKKTFQGKFVPVGPLFPVERGERTKPEASLRTPESACLPWLDAQAPGSVFYVSFGSISFTTSKQFEELALGLEASKVPFLWVIRPNSILDMDDEFYSSFKSRTRDRGLIVSWAPQLKVLQHSSTGAFLTHCGWNSVLESLSCGVPMLGWPCMFEQNTNAKLVLEGEGVGLIISRGSDGIVSRKEVETKVKSVMEDMILKARAKELQEFAVQAAAPGGLSDINFGSFVEDIQMSPAE